MDYTSYSYFKPPRPEQAIPPICIQSYENRGYVAQLKKNGTNSLIFVAPDHTLTCMTRHATPHKAWAPTAASSAIFKELPPYWYVFNAELLHSKTAQIKDVNFLFDLYVYQSQKLTDRTFAERQALLLGLFENKVTGWGKGHLVLNANTWIASCFQTDLTNLFHSLTEKENEGLVLKDPQAKLNFPGRWQVKVRKPSKSYAF